MFNSLYERERDTKGPSINFIYYKYLFIYSRGERERK